MDVKQSQALLDKYDRDASGEMEFAEFQVRVRVSLG